MKLDRLKLAKVIAFIGNIVSRQNIDSADVDILDDMIDIEVPTQPANKASCDDVDELLRQLNAPDGFIPAIKAYRVLTGAGLKESKEAIERYRSIPNFPKKVEEPATLGDILATATNQTGE